MLSVLFVRLVISYIMRLKDASTTVLGFTELLPCSSCRDILLVATLLVPWIQFQVPAKKSGDDKEYASLMLQLASSSVKPDTVVEASFKLLIYDQSYGKHSEYQGKL